MNGLTETLTDFKQRLLEQWQQWTADLTDRLYLWLALFLAVMTAAFIVFWLWIR